MADTTYHVTYRLLNLNWIPVVVMSGILLLVCALSRFSLEPVAFGTTAGIAGLLGLIAYVTRFARRNRADPKLIFSLGAISQLVLVSAIAGPLCYAAGASGLPLQDRTFLFIDRAMGLDPEPILRFVDAHPALANLLNAGYGFIKWQLLGIPIILAMSLRMVRLQVFVSAFCLAVAATIAISALIPAVGTLYGLNLSPTGFTTVNTFFYKAQLRDILALRDGSLRHLELFQLAGIVAFPSFHAASAVLYMWALRPVRGFASLSILINGVMLAATPVIGAHYMIDVIGGVALAAVSILAAKHYASFIASGSARTNWRLAMTAWLGRLSPLRALRLRDHEFQR
jgi:hypothetical protein